MQASREQILAYRIATQQLNAEPGSVDLLHAPILDFGVQDTGADSASWALANRGVALSAAKLSAAADQLSELALAWTLRSAPHFYRRKDLPEIRIATSPLSEADAGKRIFDANRPLKAAGISATTALAEVSTKMRALVTEPMVKGEVSRRLAKQVSEPYLRYCQPCKAIHLYEIPFRLAALYAGLELVPGTSPPVLQRIPDWPDLSGGPAAAPSASRPELQPIRGYLHFLGPATPAEVAKFLDAPLAEIKRHWPRDAIEVETDLGPGWVLEADHDQLRNAQPAQGFLRLLGVTDLFIQSRDRDRLVPDSTRHKELWPVIGRPGAILAGTEIVGSWRPRTSAKKLTVRLSLWTKITKATRQSIDQQAARLAEHRGLTLAGTVEE